MAEPAPRPGHFAFVLPSLTGGGAERVAITLARTMVAAGHRIDFVLVAKRGPLLAEVPPECMIVDLGAARLRDAIAPLARYLAAERPQAAHVLMWPLTIVALLARRRARVPVRLVFADHNTLSVAYRARGRLHNLAMAASIAASYRFADARIVVSAGVRDDLARLARLPRGAFEVVPNPVPLPESGLPPAAEVEALWRAPRGRRILNIGSFKAQKDQAGLIRAFAALPRHPDDRLLILGEGALRGELEALVAALGLEGRVLLPGFHADTASFYRSADLFALSSRHEGLPMVLIEAMGFGLPIVSTDCPSGPHELLDGGRLGTLVPPGDAAALARAIAAALDRPAGGRGAELRAAAAAYAPEPIAARYLALLSRRST